MNLRGGWAGRCDNIDTLRTIENVVGSRFEDTIQGDEGPNIIRGNDGHDEINGGEGSDTLSGGPGPDKLWGYLGDDLLAGRPGDDLLVGGAGNDVLRGWEGNDGLRGDAGDDIMGGGSGSDTLIYLNAPDAVAYIDLAAGTAMGEGSDVLKSIEVVRGAIHATNYLYGTNGADVLIGGWETDHIYGRGGDDRLDGRYEDDHIYGEGGNDELYGDIGNDTLIGGDGDDLLLGYRGSDTIVPGAGSDTIKGGGKGPNTLDYHDSLGPVVVDLNSGVATGSGTDDITGISRITGSDYDDTLIGNAASNWISGRTGDDLIHGEAGSDNPLALALTRSTEVPTTTNAPRRDLRVVRSDPVAAVRPASPSPPTAATQARLSDLTPVVSHGDSAIGCGLQRSRGPGPAFCRRLVREYGVRGRPLPL